jgi:MoaA/NifB/PqqE/SkfB family radical SAM enzyme
MPLSKAKKIVDGYIEGGYDGVILTGGEPTKYPKLADLIRYCTKKKIETKMITNAQKTANKRYLEGLFKAGLKHVHVSIYSHRAKVQNFLAKKDDSLENIKKTLTNLSKQKGIRTDINITFNKYNSDHLSSLAKFIISEYPFVSHFSCNNLDPTSERAMKNTKTIPTLHGFEIELVKMAKVFEDAGKTFRIERVPLCYMPGFEHVSTETRKIVKDEIRPLHFLDGRGTLVQRNFFRDKPEKCRHCALDEICAGLTSMDVYYSSKGLYPVFVSKEKIIRKIIEDENH